MVGQVRYTAQEYYGVPRQIMSLLAPLDVGRGLIDPDRVAQARQAIASRAFSQGQFAKLEVFYMPVTLIPPGAYFYDCADCVFYRQASKTCQVVQGNIEPYAWCGLWLPKEGDQPFAWLTRAWR